MVDRKEVAGRVDHQHLSHVSDEELRALIAVGRAELEGEVAEGTAVEVRRLAP